MNRQDLTLLTDLYELTMMQGYYEESQNEVVIFDVFFRQNLATMVILYVRDLHR